MTLFKIIDRETGEEPTDRVIAAQARLGNLIFHDIDGFYVGEDGQIILVDDCGNCTWLDMGRFKVELQTGAEVLDKIRAEIEGYSSTIDNAISEDELKIEGMKEAYADCLKIIDKYKASPIGTERRK